MPSSPSPDQIVSQSPAAMTVPEFCRWARLGGTATYREVAARPPRASQVRQQEPDPRFAMPKRG